MVKDIVNLRILLIILASLHGTMTVGQNALTNESFGALDLFESFQARQYRKVIHDFSTASFTSADSDILLLMSELRAGKDRALEIEAWLDANEQHPIKPLVNFLIGEHYFYAQDTVKAKEYLEKIVIVDLSVSDQSSYGFVYGLLQVQNGAYANALELLSHARKLEYDPIEPINYYEAFCHYHLDQKEEALSKFKEVNEDEVFGGSSRFYMAKIHLENQQPDSVIALANEEITDESSRINSGFYQLIGEAYAMKEDEGKADAYFERAIQLHPATPSAALYYQAGVAKFKIGNEDQAIEYFTNSGIQGGVYAQLSAFQLGRLHVKKEDFEKALSAYTEASASEDELIRSESYYQLARINAQLGLYDQSLKYAEDYLNTYQDGTYRVDIQNLMAETYLRTSNYDLAINHLNEIGISGKTLETIYQKVTFQKAILSFNDGRLDEARRWFTESLTFNRDQSLSDASNFHLGEIALRKEQFKDAIAFYRRQSSIDGSSLYGIGYAYYNLGNYQDAIPPFKGAVQGLPSSPQQRDAHIRLADCLFATKRFSEALTAYSVLLSTQASDYLIHQKGMTLRNLERYDEAITTLKMVGADSRYGASSRFQAGLTQFEMAKFIEARAFFTEVIERYPTSTLVSRALLNRGVASKNLGELSSAKEDYEEILDNHLATDEALNAILGLQELQQLGEKVNKLDKHIAAYKAYHPESGSLELIELEAAKQYYYKLSYEEAARAFDQFLKAYPQSGSTLEVTYLLGDSYYRMDRLPEAKKVFDELISVRNEFTARILNRLGETNRRLELVEETEKVFQLLISLDLSQKDTYNAQRGLMLVFYNAKDHQKTVEWAEAILESDWKPINAEKEAMMLAIRSWLALNEPEKASSYLMELSKGSDVYAAESRFYQGQLRFEEGHHLESLDILFELNAELGNYSEWIDQSYLLIAKNYMGMNENFQAKATLRSIVQHGTDPAVRSEAQSLLDSIEQSTVSTDSIQNER